MQNLLPQYRQLTAKIFYWSNIGEITDFCNTLWYTCSKINVKPAVISILATTTQICYRASIGVLTDLSKAFIIGSKLNAKPVTSNKCETCCHPNIGNSYLNLLSNQNWRINRFKMTCSKMLNLLPQDRGLLLKNFLLIQNWRNNRFAHSSRRSILACLSSVARIKEHTITPCYY